MSTRYESITEKSWSYYFLVFAINSFFFYLVTLEKIFIQAALMLVFISSLLVIRQRINGRLSNQKLKRNAIRKRFNPDFKDFMNITKTYFRINRINILFATTAIIIPSIILAQISIVHTTQQQSSLNSFLDNSDVSTIRIRISDVSLDTFQNWEKYFDANHSRWISDPDFKILQSYTYGVVSFKIIMGERYNFDNLERWIDFVSINSQQWTLESYELLSKLPTFPDFDFNSSESFLMLPVTLSGGNLGINRDLTGGIRPGEAIPPKSYTADEFLANEENHSKFKILTDSPLKYPVEDFSEPFLNISHSVDRYWQLTYQDIQYIDKNEINLPGSFSVGSMFVPKNQSLELFDSLQQYTYENDLDDRIWGEFGLESVVFTTIPSIEQKSPDKFVNNLNEITNNIAVEINEIVNKVFKDPSDDVPVQVFSPLRDRYGSFWENVSALNYIYLLTALPLLLLSLYLFYFSQILSKRSYDRNWRNITNRGATPNQLRALIITEAVSISLGGSLIGFILSLPLSNISINSFDLSELNILSLNLTIPFSLYWRLPLIALTIVANFNLTKFFEIKRYYSVSRSAENATRNEVNRDLMVILVILISSIYWLIRIPNNESLLNGVISGEELFRQLDLLFFVGIMAGLPLLLSSQFGNAVRRVLPVIKWDLLEIAIKNLNRHKHLVKHLIVVIFTSIMISSSVLVVQHSILENEIERGKYLNGADILIDDININNKELMSQLEIEGVRSITEMIFFEYKLQNWEMTEVQKHQENIPFHFLGINITTFGETAYWSDEYSNGDLQGIVNGLNEAGNVAVDMDTKERFRLEKNRPLRFQFGLKGQLKLIMIATEFFSLYPNFIEQDPQEVKKNYIVGSLFTVDYIAFVTRSVVDKRVYLKTDPNYNIRDITENLRTILKSETSVKIYSHEEAQRTIFSDIDDGNDLVKIESELLTMMTDILVAYAFLIAIMISVYYSLLINLIREREFEIYRALGATNKQKSRIIFLELSLIAAFTIVFAIISSLFLAKIFNFILIDSVANVIPPFEIKYPLAQLSGLVVLYITTITIATIFIARYISNKKSVGLLRNN